MKIITLQSLGLFLLYISVGVAMLAAFVRLYIFVTPYDEREHIPAGKVAPAVALVGAMIGFTLPLVSASYHGVNFVDYVVWGVVAGLVQLACFKVLYWLMPGHIEANNAAIATVYAGASVCVGLFNAFALIP